MKHLKNVLVLIVLLLTSQELIAQDDAGGNSTVKITIPEVAIVDLESSTGKNISLTINAPQEAGLAVDMTEASDSSIWLNYSSVRSQSGEPNRSIYARITSGSVPSGLRLRVKAMDYSGSGDGGLGRPGNANGRVLNNSDKRVVKGIKTCYTGDGAGNGHQLIYTLEFRNNQYSRIDFSESGAVTVLYTISDN